MGGLDLAKFFYSHESSREQYKEFISGLIDEDKDEDPTIILLALQSFYNIEDVVQKQQFNFDENDLRTFLMRWRNEATFSAYHMLSSHTVPLLRCLTIFKHYEVPLFVDDCGQRRLMSIFKSPDDMEDIDEDSKIFHVTHGLEADLILKDGKLKSCDSKNIIPGVWFGMKDPQKYGSVYGSKSFQFTLKDFGITGLVQGEIVTYEKECSVILYATDDEDADFDYEKPTRKSAKKLLDREDGYVRISIFIPNKILNKYFSRNQQVPQPVDVTHSPFCARELRSAGKYKCGQQFNEPLYGYQN